MFCNGYMYMYCVLCNVYRRREINFVIYNMLLLKRNNSINTINDTIYLYKRVDKLKLDNSRNQGCFRAFFLCLFVRFLLCYSLFCMLYLKCILYF